ncbi:MAG: hypothetical protein KJ063_19560 [Anaerolineae bacterium]|nr:hypothetical protein [Anaerolineae bacterium]
MPDVLSENITKAFLIVLDETFNQVRGIYLDKGDSLFETLATITAAEASVPVGGKCATLAAQVKHVAFYLDVVVQNVRDQQYHKVDWGEIWRTVKQVTPEEWEQIQAELRVSYQAILQLLEGTTTWENEMQIGGAMGMIAHTAYHLGEIRQALCTLRD